MGTFWNGFRRRGGVVLALLSLLVASGIVAALPASAAVVSRPALTGLTNLIALTVAPDGRVLVGDEGGTIRVFNPATNSSAVMFRVPNNRQLLGLTAHWDFPRTPYVYGFGSRRVANGTDHVQLFRFRVTGSTGSNLAVLADFGLRPGDHQGGPIAFGPDRLLYLSIGDGGTTPQLAQNLGSARGKILRMTAAGGIPSGNPFGTRVFAYGQRNAFGLGWDPRSNRLWATDNGPECNDEMNQINRGANYAWGPSAVCDATPTAAETNQDGPSRVLPKRTYSAPTAPTGLAFCASCGLGSVVEGNLVYATFVTSQIRRVPLNTARTGLGAEVVLLQHSSGIVGLQRAPNGVLWFIDRTSLRRLVNQ